MAYLDQAALAADANFQLKIKVGIATAAVQIAGEDKASLSDAVYTKRQALATSVLLESPRWVERFAWAVASNAAVTSGSSDSDIQFTINAQWNDLAGVTGLD
ncbi:hypothetical protein Ssi03_62630 [Sphaerisporangium siamense]|uniref:Uncharacterized protein n=1 Tax=Sphaerisporangium siamense TaxID=795645 RepID=A0A7W7D9N8_9ACTN|nr:hypothetical protein [Sphaerisporangium siamense]MBB4702571.1 hypothetical protein [Sphaerisporangium siamense]GII88273.1 hypothetical protein Ssi03_62630 [Sphaerisporangium siamense]